MHCKRTLAACIPLLLTACATHAPNSSGSLSQGPQTADSALLAKAAPSSSRPPAKPDQSLKNGKGYYKDDGPIADVPYDLDSLAEPVPKTEVLNRSANKPYMVLGRTFTPMTALAPFSQRGVASWYGRKFNGQRTSSGETYDMFQLTAAHPTLPIPSYARVTNLQNGKSIIVRVNDRGPFLKDRVMDLSYAAAYRLGYHAIGSAAVQVDLLMAGDVTPVTPPEINNDDPLAELLASDLAADKESVPAPLVVVASGSPTTDNVWLQLGAFGSPAAADSFRARMQSDLEWLGGQVNVVQGERVWRVRLGPYENRDAARIASNQIASRSGLKPLIVR